jgi:cytochrome d ubiquinol oxidase subunit I
MIDALILARIQFAANVSFHILFPSITVAMGWIILFFKLRYDYTKNEKWMEAYKFWIKVFALCFALGVVSGITMSFQFGTNWPGFMHKVGNVAGPLLAYEVLTAFFLEATFLGIMLFGYNKVSNRVHTISTFIVAIGTCLSVFWIIVLNSWMQTPQGFELIDNKAHVTSWLEVIFNPSMPYRLTHMFLASGLTASFLIAGISSYRWLLGDKKESVMAALKTAIYVAAIMIPLQIYVGDSHGLNTLKYQPAKIAAIEAIWQTEKDVPLQLFAIPDKETKKNDYSIAIPKLGSIILTHTLNGEIKGLNEFPDHPPVLPVFFSFRVMVGIGMLMLITAWFGAWQLYKYNKPGKLLAKILVAMSFSGCFATLAGWYTTEIGRQPWLVYGVLKTSEALGSVEPYMIITSLSLYLTIYFLLIFAFVLLLFYLSKKATLKG